jgi:PAS domain S-box-containing protein
MRNGLHWGDRVGREARQTERSRARARQDALLDMVRTLAGSLDEQHVCELAARHAVDLLGAPYARLRLREPDGTLRCVAAAGLVGPQTLGRTLPVDSVSGVALEQGLLNLPDAAAHPDWRPDLDWLAGRTRAYLGVALRRSEQSLGVLEVMGTARRRFSLSAEQLLVGLANAAAVAVDNARLYRAAQDEVVARRQAEERFQRLAEASFEAVVIHEQGVIREANLACRTLFGYEPGELIGRSVLELTPPESREEIARRIRTGSEEAYEAVGLRKDGSVFYGELRAKAIAYNGRRARVVSIRDVTDVVEQAARREGLLRDNARLYETAQSAIRLRDEVLATVAHDLRGPLTKIRLRAETLREQMDNGEAPSPEQISLDLCSIEAATVKLGQHVGELLQATRVQSERDLVLQRQPIDLACLVRAMASEHFGPAQNPPVVVDVEDTVVGWWDAARLERVVENLMANARAYSPADEPIRLVLRRDEDEGGDWAVLEVQDRGLGIPAGDLPHIGEPFYRGSNVRGRITGTGLGLAGCRRILEQHGGSLRLASLEGAGTTVTVRLPLSPEGITVG